MKVSRDKVVTFSYILKNKNHEELERSDEGEPMAYLHGHNNILFFLEKALEGCIVGDQLDVELKASQAYGLRDESACQRIPIKHLSGNPKKLKIGDHVKINTENGIKDGTVIKAGKFNIDVDTNHPYAGLDLIFDVRIKEVRDAEPDELSHGHAHGVGGHQH